jgi:hypothetical protein
MRTFWNTACGLAYSMISSGSPYSTGTPLLTRMRVTTPA